MASDSSDASGRKVAEIMFFFSPFALFPSHDPRWSFFFLFLSKYFQLGFRGKHFNYSHIRPETCQNDSRSPGRHFFPFFLLLFLFLFLFLFAGKWRACFNKPRKKNRNDQTALNMSIKELNNEILIRHRREFSY